ncbi:hypothetical protein HGH93_16135 [Chitinophaga polysaccharea]|uniref:hypothetical protein n=1 Tax=Chitinophaga TaxID=79328 RepID=UPI001454F1EA|nr:MULTISPECIES: hypothetical protein [Chitinophaga]NLR59643.1 hypothetical protein [Chitinophaga polysaccharea]NLU93996.1 hypothetical protein [Chitinophaga sp. Ak27]
MFNKNTLLTGAVTAAVLGISFSSCKKDNNDPIVPTPRSKTYELKGTTGDDKDKKIGTVTLKENLADTGNSVIVVLNLDKNTKDAEYNVYLIKGTIAAPTTDTIFRPKDLEKKAISFKGTGIALTHTMVDKINTIKLYQPNNVRTEIKFKYDDVLALSSFLKVATATGTETLAIGSFGK